ncbi:MAG: 4Fe-4S binding protein [bacterium]|jgi:NAD-dependent dihydropyrimidine dehydrogenase PreA subunit
MKRDIVTIDEEKCTGCGECVPNCPEGAIQIIDGKARLVSDLSCDGLGACIGHCPEGAMSVENREAEPYDERKVMVNIVKAGPATIKAHLLHLKDHNQTEFLSQAMGYLKEKGITPPDLSAGEEATANVGCPGMKMMDFREEAGRPGGEAAGPDAEGRGTKSIAARSELRQWPVQLQLLNANAPYFQDADLVIAADCVPFAYPGFHNRFLKGKALIILCPKLDRVLEQYLDKLTEIFKNNDIKSITVVHMEVPCCFGLGRLVEEALKRSGKNTIIKDYTVSIKGDII